MKHLLRYLKKRLRAALGKELFVRPEIRCSTERLGTDYGGWEIVTDPIDPDSLVYSFGVGEDASFDVECIEKYDLTVHAFDPTPKSIAWVRQQGFSDRFVMHEYGIAAFDGTVSFNPPENPDHVSHTMLDRPSTQQQAITVPVKRLETIMEELGHTGKEIGILKMDIEGAEYDVIADLNHSTIRPRQILIEFHHRFPGVGIERTKDAIASIRSMGYQLFAVSRTNEEFSFLRKAA